MCGTCGCDQTSSVSVELGERILAGNERLARHNREHFEERGVLAVNVMGSPGSGKTALLEATARATAGKLRLGALAGDLTTDRDAVRLAAAGIRAVSISTGSACHLDAAMVHHALHGFPWRDLDTLFIENVGNLVCPALYDLGQAANVVTLSVTEGEDKPLKYPVMFKNADAVLLTKVDLLRALPEVRVNVIADALARVMPRLTFFTVSARTGEGIERWLDWLQARRPRATSARLVEVTP
jgi:hydrogenase nickel incorporation protein HypB